MADIIEAGRPPKLNDKQKQELLVEYENYIRATDDPTISHFVTTNQYCFEHRVLDHDIEQWQEFTDLKKLAQKKQEAYLLRAGGKGDYNPTMAIFRLKQPQHGYTDRQQIDAKVEQVQPIISLEDNAVHRNDSNQED